MTQGSSSGLEGIVVADTQLSDVDGERGRLVLAGHDVEALAGRVGYEGVIGLLRAAPPPDLGAARAAAFARLPQLGDALSRPDGMDALRAAVAHLASSAGADEIIGAVAVFAAAWARARRGRPAVEPDPALGHAEDLLRMIDGARPDPARVHALDAYLVTVVDHGMNASTFAARVVASTGSDRVSAVVAALGALKGPLHGGAPGPVLDMLDAIGEPSRAADWLEGELAAGRRIMGMGHRVYRVRDPRAAVLERAASELERAASELGRGSARLRLARAVEQAAEGILARRHPNRPLRANVEFYTAILLDTVGIPRELFTPVFAVGRVGGWLAHFDEQIATGRLIRPSSRYVGPVPGSHGATSSLGQGPTLEVGPDPLHSPGQSFRSRT
jgi:citrate synthase